VGSQIAPYEEENYEKAKSQRPYFKRSFLSELFDIFD
jgi:hypothetical protein